MLLIYFRIDVIVSIVIAAFSLIATVLLVVGLLVYSGRKPRHLYVQLYS